jgi:hypothetical protein
LVRRLRGFMWPMARRANQDGLYLSGNGARNLGMKNYPRRRRSVN